MNETSKKRARLQYVTKKLMVSLLQETICWLRAERLRPNRENFVRYRGR